MGAHGTAGLVDRADFAPLIPDFLALANNVSIPHRADDEQSDASVREAHREDPTNGGEASKVFSGAIGTVFRHIRNLIVVEHMSQGIQHHQETTEETEIERPVNFPMASETLLELRVQKDAHANPDQSG